MTTKDYVSYPLALALKKAGFDLAVNHYYDEKGDFVESLADYNNEDSFNSQETAYDDFNHGYCDEISCSAPTLAQAQKWLREKHRISVRVNYLFGYCGWFADWLNLDSGEYDYVDSRYKSYERALSAGIAAALGLIGEKGD